MMLRFAAPLALFAFAAGHAVPAAAQDGGAAFRTAPVAFPQYPSIAPDGSTVVFAHGGDLWSVPAAGGTAVRLTSHPSDETRSAFSPCGTMLAFESEREGARSIYLMPLTRAGDALVGGSVRRITVLDRAHTLSGFSADGTSILFASSHEPGFHRTSRMYRAPVGDADAVPGSLMERLTDAYGGAAQETPDGTALLFHRGRLDATRPKYVGSAASDVYRLDRASGAFTRLTHDPHHDGDAYGLPDGSIVFTSSRDGQNNLWKLMPGKTDQDGSALTQLTRFAPATGEPTIGHGVRDFAVAPGGWTGVFCVWNTMYTIDLRAPGSEAAPIAVTAGGDIAHLDYQRMNLSKQVTEAALSPDGKSLAVVARGEIFVRSTDKDRPTRHVTGPGPVGSARARDLAWSPDGRVLYFASDASGVPGIYTATVALTRQDLGAPEAPPSAEEAPPPEAPAADPQPEPLDPATATDQADEAAPPEAATEVAPGVKEPAAPKPKRPDHGKRWADSITFDIAPAAVGEIDHRNPLPSPDGKRLLLTRGDGDLILVDLDAEGFIKPDTERLLLDSWTAPEVLWTADSRHLIYELTDVYFNSDIWVMDALAEDPAATAINITRHPDIDHAPRLSADGKVLYFLSDRDAPINGQHDIFAVNLDRKLDGLRPYELADYFKEAAEKAKKRRPLGAPAESRARAIAGRDTEESATAPKSPAADRPLTFDAEDAYLRIRKVVGTSGNVRAMTITPGGERIIFSGAVDGANALHSVDSAGKDRKSVYSGSATALATSLTGDKVVFIATNAAARDPDDDEAPRGGAGEAHTAKPAGGDLERQAIDAPVTVDIAAQQRQKFTEAARTMGARFYHPSLKGLDWPALTQQYLSLAVQTRTDPEFNRIFAHLLGELDGSHLGISGGRSTAGSTQTIGYLGAETAPTPGGFKVTRVASGGPADARTSRLSKGDVILSINRKPLAADHTQHPQGDFNAAMLGAAGQETLLEVCGPEGKNRWVLITPVSSAANANLWYQDEVLRRAALVDQLSGGKLGYLHIRSMNMASVRDFERDLFAAADGKLGLIIDVRDNGGGSTTDILLSSLTAPRHAYTAARGMDMEKLPSDAYPRDRRLIYGYTRPITVLINQHSYSNAEIFAHAIRTIGRGTLVGVPTFGAVISTGSVSLIDGTTMRMPFRGWYLPDGTDMENNGAQPHLLVHQTPEDEVAGDDRQLKAAAQELLTRAGEP